MSSELNYFSWGIVAGCFILSTSLGIGMCVDRNAEPTPKHDTIQTKINAAESRYMASDTFRVITSLTGFKNQTRLALNVDPMYLVAHNIPVQTFDNGCFSYLLWEQVWISMFDKFGNLCPISYAYVSR